MKLQGFGTLYLLKNTTGLGSGAQEVCVWTVCDENCLSSELKCPLRVLPMKGSTHHQSPEKPSVLLGHSICDF